MADRFQLRISIEIMKLTGDGGYTGERMTVNQEYTLPVAGFTEIAAVLGRFYDLAQEVKADGT